MNEPIVIYVPAIPVAQPRVKAGAFGGKARVWTPTTIRKSDGTKKSHPIVEFKATIRMAAAEIWKLAPLTGPLRIDVCAVFPRTQAQVWKTRPMPRLPHEKKPDRDNVDKAVLDALKGIVFADDCQACVGLIEKWVAAGDEQPHVKITVSRLEC